MRSTRGMRCDARAGAHCNEGKIHHVAHASEPSADVGEGWGEREICFFQTARALESFLAVARATHTRHVARSSLAPLPSPTLETVKMAKRKRLSDVGRDGEVSPSPACARARPHTRPVSSSLTPSPKDLGLKTVTIEELLTWAFAREKVHIARPEGLGELSGHGPRGWPKASNSERIGASVGSSMNLGFEAPTDAYAVLAAVRAQGPLARMLRDYAIMKARPDWTPCPEITVERGRTGHTVHIDRRNKRHLCPFRSFVYRGDVPAVLAQRRSRYQAWARAMQAVHKLLSRPGVLRAHRLAPDVPPLAPWEA